MRAGAADPRPSRKLPAHLRGPLLRYFFAGGSVSSLLLAALWVMVLRPV